MLEHMAFELVPLKNATALAAQLPTDATVTITCSPTKGIEATLDLASELRGRGLKVIPHLSARMVKSTEHVTAIARRVDQLGIDTIFVIGGDAPEPFGPFADAAALLDALLEASPGVGCVGLGGYPDGHPIIDTAALGEALHEKVDLVTASGRDAYVATQMCFDAAIIRSWLTDWQLRTPVHVGVPGAVDRTRLLRMSLQLGVGASARFLKKNRNSILRLFTPGGYNANVLIDDLAPDAEELGIAGLHCFTFNSVEATVRWRDQTLRRLRRRR